MELMLPMCLEVIPISTPLQDGKTFSSPSSLLSVQCKQSRLWPLLLFHLTDLSTIASLDHALPHQYPDLFQPIITRLPPRITSVWLQGLFPTFWKFLRHQHRTPVHRSKMPSMHLPNPFQGHEAAGAKPTRSNLKSAVNLCSMCLDWGRKLEKTLTCTGRACKLYTQEGPAGKGTKAFLLWEG